MEHKVVLSEDEKCVSDSHSFTFSSLSILKTTFIMIHITLEEYSHASTGVGDRYTFQKWIQQENGNIKLLLSAS